MPLSSKEKQARYRSRKRAEKAAEKLRADTVTDAPGPSEPVTEDKADLLDQFCDNVGPKPNPRPLQPGDKEETEKKPEDEHKIETPKPPMPLPPAIWKFLDSRLRSFFEKEIRENPTMAPKPLDDESARYMSEALGEGMAYSKVTVNPWYGFGIMMFMFILPYLLLAFKKFSKDKKKKERDTVGELAALGVPVPDAVQPPEPAPGPNAGGEPAGGGAGGGLVGDIGARDAKLAESYVNSGTPPDRKNDAGIQAP